MNAWDIDPSLYAPLWRLLREWYLRRKQAQTLPHSAKPGPNAGSRA